MEQLSPTLRGNTVIIQHRGGTDSPASWHSMWMIRYLLTQTKKLWRAFSNWRSSSNCQHTRYETPYRLYGLGTSGGMASVKVGPAAESRGASSGSAEILGSARASQSLHPPEELLLTGCVRESIQVSEGRAQANFSFQKTSVARRYESEG